jgi:hypothetical protein
MDAGKKKIPLLRNRFRERTGLVRFFLSPFVFAAHGGVENFAFFVVNAIREPYTHFVKSKNLYIFLNL